MASSIYGKEVSLPKPGKANNLKSIGGQNKPAGMPANTFIAQTAVSPMGKARPYSNIAVNAMGKNGTMQNNAVPKVKKLKRN